MTFAHVRASGLQLRRSVPRFDELGCPVVPEYAPHPSLQDLDTRALPSADASGGTQI